MVTFLIDYSFLSCVVDCIQILIHLLYHIFKRLDTRGYVILNVKFPHEIRCCGSQQPKFLMVKYECKPLAFLPVPLFCDTEGSH